MDTHTVQRTATVAMDVCHPSRVGSVFDPAIDAIDFGGIVFAAAAMVPCIYASLISTNQRTNNKGLGPFWAGVINVTFS